MVAPYEDPEQTQENYDKRIDSPGVGSTGAENRDGGDLIDPQDQRRETAIESDEPGYNPYLDTHSAPELSYGEFTSVAPNAVDESLEEGETDPNNLAAEIAQRLSGHDQLKGKHIRVAVNGGQVLLQGRVDTPLQ
ncbi:MAG: BON domain-containing protein [Anaerolineae bacterium]